MEISEILSRAGAGAGRGTTGGVRGGEGRKEAENTIRRERNNEIPIDA